MNKIDNEEITRLMRVTSETLRRNWERVMNNGEKLEDIISSRENAIVVQKTCKRSAGLSLIILPPLLMIFLLWLMIMVAGGHSGFTLKFTLTALVALAIFVACNWSVYYWSEKSNKMWRQIAEHDKILEKFKVSVDALNPLGIGNVYHDLITDTVVTNRTIDLAYKVIDAEDHFERLLKPGAIRTDVVCAGQWIDKCNGWFDRIWQAATVDFALELTRREVFAKATEDFTLREGRKPAHLANE